MLLVDMREKQLVFLVCLLFVGILILFHLLLPEMPEGGSISVMRRNIERTGNRLLLPKLGGNVGGMLRHGAGESKEDLHQARDKEALLRKISLDQGFQRQKLESDLSLARLELSKLRKEISKDKLQLERMLQARKAEGEGGTVPGAGGSLIGGDPIEKRLSRSEELQGGEPKDAETKRRRDVVRDMMVHAWNNYVRYAWRSNELKPISKTGHTTSIFGAYPIGATIVDAADTLYLMGLNKEFDKARQWIAGQLSFDFPSEVSVFEFNIRFLGGLLSLYAFTGDKIFVEKATDLADRLLPAFDTETGLPRALINLKSRGTRNYHWASGGCSILSEFGTLHMEFAYLSEITGKTIYREKVDAIRKRMAHTSKPNGLYPNYMNSRTGTWCQHHSSLAGLGDSFYEYLLKEWVRTGGRDKEARKLYDEAMVAVERYMLKQSPGGLRYLGDYKFGRVESKMDHLACFAGGMFAMSAAKSKNPEKWMRYGADITSTCYQSYHRSATHLGPESFRFDNGNEAVAVMAREKVYMLRPETVESYFYLWRLTKDPKYREWGWEAVQALERHCKTDGGYSGLRDVYAYSPSKDDVQQSFFLAETLKYLYLLFSEDTLLPLDRWVFNTEAHPFPVRR